MTMIYQVSKDGQLKQECMSHNEAFIYILKAQGQSVHYAIQYGGWRIVKVSQNEKDEAHECE